MVIKALIISAGLLLIVFSGNSSAQEQIAQLKQPPFNESFEEEAPVSGRVVAGISLTGSTATKSLMVNPPIGSMSSNVCIRVMSRDGRYWSMNTFQLPTTVTNSPVVLDYPTRHQFYLEGLKFDELAVLGFEGECNDSNPSHFLLAGTGASLDISVFVNSGRADTYVAVKNVEQRKRPRRCNKIEAGRRTGFDTVCQVDLADLDNISEMLEIRILRRRYERMLPPTEFTLMLPRFP